ncbi:MAG: DUF1629 domain-containing protein [Parvibaculaceae bacterium]
MVEFLRSLFGAKEASAPEPVVSAAAAAAAAAATAETPSPVAGPPPPASDYVECAGRRFFEILETYQNRARPLHDQVTWDKEEEARLRDRRIEAYQLRNGTDYRPHDVFHLWPYQAVDPAHVIRQATLKTGMPKTLPEYSQIMNVNVVSERVMKAIASLEDGRHAFYPLEILEPEGGVSHRHHFMQFLEHTDCTVPRLGGFRKGVRQDNSTYWVRMSDEDKVWLDAERVGTRHLFHDKRAKSGCFISGELAAKLGDFLPRGYYLAESGMVRRKAGPEQA